MSIETQLIAAKGYLDNCYLAVANCGGTIPQNKCLENLPDAIDSIDSSSVYNYCIPKYSVDQSGNTTIPVETYSPNIFSSIITIGDYALYYAFQNRNFFTSLSFDNLTTIGNNGLVSAFMYCTSLTSVSFPALTTISDGCGIRNAFEYCSNLASVDLSGLTTITTNTSNSNLLAYTFGYCTALRSVDLSNLTSITGTGTHPCYRMFQSSGLITISFPKLTTISMSTGITGIFEGCTDITEIHFKSSAQTVIENQAGYSGKFGASNATIYFDL